MCPHYNDHVSLRPHACVLTGHGSIRWYLIRNMTDFGKIYFPLSNSDKNTIFELSGYRRV